MKKIPTIFERDWNGDRALVTHEPNPDAAWVFAGEGIATEKFDGTACLIDRDPMSVRNVLFKRYDAKHGKTPPEGFMPAQEPDLETGHWPGWLRIGDGPDDRWFREAVADNPIDTWTVGTYELVGPKVQGNPYNLTRHSLRKHGQIVLSDAPRDFDAIRTYLVSREVEGINGLVTFEGIVWHHPDGRMAKIKRRDFGLPWPIKAAQS